MTAVTAFPDLQKVRLYDGAGNPLLLAAADGGVAAQAQFMTQGVFNGTTVDRARGVIGDAQAATGLQAVVPHGYNGTTYDRLKSYSGARLMTTPMTQTAVLQASTTQTATGASSDLTVPAGFYVITFLINITAVSGTSPTMVVAAKTKLANGAYTSAVGNLTSSLNSVGTTGFGISPGPLGTGNLGPTYQLTWTIGGTTPSFTFTIEAFWR